MALTDLFPPEHKNKVLAVAFTAVGVIFGVIILSTVIKGGQNEERN